MWALLSAAAAAALSGSGIAGPQGVANPDAKPARDGDVAIAEELCAARSAGTIAAYDLFIARHPGHRLEKLARSERADIAAGRPSKTCPCDPANP